MQNDQSKIPVAKELIEKANSIIVLLPPQPNEDQVVAGVSLFLSLKEMGKETQIGCPSEFPSKSGIKGLEHIKDTVGSRNLMVTFDYPEQYLEKVDYDIRDGGKFVLMVKPKKDAPVPDVSDVKFSYSGAEADLIITLGVHSLEELGKIYAEEKDFIDQCKILSLNISPRPANFQAEFLHLFVPSFVELVALLLEKSQLKTSSDAASNLILSLFDHTQNLTSPRINADTFSSIAYLMREGGKLPHQQSNRLAQASFFDSGSSQMEAEEENASIPQDWKKPKIFNHGGPLSH